MIRNIGEGPKVPRWFLRELKIIDPNFQVVWDSQKLLIVSPAPVNVFRKGFIPEFVIEPKEEEFSLVIKVIRRLMWEKENGYPQGYTFEEHMKMLKEETYQRRKKAKTYRLEAERQFEKKARKLHTSQTFT